MKQILVFGKMEKVLIQEPKTLNTVLRETMITRGLDLALFDQYKNQVIFSVDNGLTRLLDTVVKVGQTVRLIPAVKAG